MLPIAPLMIEHRLIERMIKVIESEIERLEKTEQVDDIFIDKAVDFIRVYADQTHHGKEEEILFRELKKKQLKEPHQETMEELIQEHIWGRRTTGNLLKAIKGLMKDLVEFYPKHIEKEDKHFFVPVMDYFTDDEKNAMLEEGHEFDRKMIHRKYESDVSAAEKRRKLETEDSDKKRLDFLWNIIFTKHLTFFPNVFPQFL